MYHSPPVAAKDGGFAGALKRKAHAASPLSAHTAAPAGGAWPLLPDAPIHSKQCPHQSELSRQKLVAPQQWRQGSHLLFQGHYMH
jgi:hypothetical protein